MAVIPVELAAGYMPLTVGEECRRHDERRAVAVAGEGNGVVAVQQRVADGGVDDDLERCGNAVLIGISQLDSEAIDAVCGGRAGDDTTGRIQGQPRR